MKRRSLTLVLCLLATLSLASVGFAAWVISAGATENATGQILVETVTDKRLVMIVPDSIGDFNLGTPESMENGEAWLNAEDVSTEVLEISFDIILAYASDTKNREGKYDPNTAITAASLEELEAVLTIVDAATGETDKTAEATTTYGYLSALNATVAEKVPGTGGTFTVTISINWGALFGNKNPYDYYNDQDIDATAKYDENGLPKAEGTQTLSYGDHAYKYMRLMDDFFAANKFKVSISAKTSNS